MWKGRFKRGLFLKDDDVTIKKIININVEENDLRKGGILLFKNNWFIDFWNKRIVEYVVSRQNEDGGYTFCQGTESNVQDTYYGLAILDLLNVSFPNIEKTIEWLHGFIPDTLYSHYYVAKALDLCGEKPDKESLKNFILSLPVVNGKFEPINTYIEVASEFLSIFMTIELVNIACMEVNREKIIDWLLNFKNNDGGFGVYGYSNLNSTYYAVASLFNLGYPVKSLKETLAYVRACEKPYGGFSAVPNSSSIFMEHIYYGVETLNLLDESLRYPKQTVEFILKCQNANGGFARSHIGISTFEDTFYAVSIIQKIVGRG
ncbi:MAG: prenyltransferase/squalene oxidase repeat-containing protein [Candidatus Bathyarchaeia archaeon]